MIYNQRNNIKGKVIKTLGLGAVLLLVFFFFRSSLSGAVVRVVTPVLNAYKTFSSSLSSGFQFLEPKQTLIEENKTLKEEAMNLSLENLRLRATLSEANIFTASSTRPANSIEALAISFPPQTPYDTILINRGENDGVRNGAKVYLGDRVEVGSVEEVYTNKAKVRLFSSSGIKTEAVLERTGEVAELVGAGGGSFELKLPISFDILEGDTFVLPGLPRTIVAETISIKKDETSSFAAAFLSFPVKINGNSLFYVEI